MKSGRRRWFSSGSIQLSFSLYWLFVIASSSEALREFTLDGEARRGVHLPSLSSLTIRPTCHQYLTVGSLASLPTLHDFSRNVGIIMIGRSSFPSLMKG